MIGFVQLEIHNNVEDAIGAGSGTLISVGRPAMKSMSTGDGTKPRSISDGC
jgi:hypothetical protein